MSQTVVTYDSFPVNKVCMEKESVKKIELDMLEFLLNKDKGKQIMYRIFL